MKLHRRRPGRRGGFTLIELMVVVTIIAVLVSLLSSAIIVAINKMDEVKTRNEISSLGSGLTQFQSEFNVQQKGAPPSRLWLDETGTYSTPPAGFTAAQVGQLATDSKAYLVKVWPRLAAGNGNILPVDWNSDGTTGNSSVILEGQQCLVFFLGGARNASGSFIGFSNDPANPINLSLTTRKGPYFQFDMSRINYKTPNNGYPCYLDPYGMPYAYFSSGSKTNGYNPYAPGNPPNSAAGLGFDCPSLGNIGPYYQPTAAGQPIVYYNADTFQIISAGKNTTYGPGGSWTSSQGVGMSGGKAGIDDLSNFYNTKLGTTP